jgi:hypothetical protein
VLWQFFPTTDVQTLDRAGRRKPERFVGRTTRMGVEHYQDYTLWINDDRDGRPGRRLTDDSSVLTGSTSSRMPSSSRHPRAGRSTGLHPRRESRRNRHRFEPRRPGLGWERNRRRVLEAVLRAIARSGMDETIARFKTPESCEQFALNVEKHSPERALEARRRAVELRALAHGASTEAERDALEAVYAYERVLSTKRGKRIRASRTWQMIQRHGILAAVERVVSRPAEAAGYTALVQMGMQDKAFEAVVLRHPDVFSDAAVALSKARLAEWLGSNAPRALIGHASLLVRRRRGFRTSTLTSW